MLKLRGEPLQSEVGSTISAGYVKMHGMLYEIFQPCPEGFHIRRVKLIFTAFNGQEIVHSTLVS